MRPAWARLLVSCFLDGTSRFLSRGMNLEFAPLSLRRNRREPGNKRDKMFRLQAAGSKRILTFSLLAALGLLTMGLMVLAGTGLSRKIISERQARLIAELQSNVADSPAFLAERLFALQLDRIILFVPGMSKPVSLPAGRCSFDPKTFPETAGGARHPADRGIKRGWEGFLRVQSPA